MKQKVYLTQTQMDLIACCMEDSVFEFSYQEMEDYKDILQSFVIAQESIQYDF